MLVKLHLFLEEIREDKVKDGSPEVVISMASQLTQLKHNSFFLLKMEESKTSFLMFS